MNVLLATTYFGPIQWYQKLYRADHAWIECCESFQKQTYRNRCLIATTQGVQALTVPIASEGSTAAATLTAAECAPVMGGASPSGFHASLITAVRISDHGQWRRLHWNALQSAYGESPFFEYYEDDLRPFFEPRWEYLFQLNEAIRQKMCELIDIRPQVSFTTQYIGQSTVSVAVGGQKAGEALNIDHDYRDAIQPKHPAPDADFRLRDYYQVYRQKHGFLPNLSILDLLLNMGPESIFYL